jgi:hypothetical protein
MLVFPKIIIEAAVQCYHRQLLKVSNFTKTNLDNEFPNFISCLLSARAGVPEKNLRSRRCLVLSPTAPSSNRF